MKLVSARTFATIALSLTFFTAVLGQEQPEFTVGADIVSSNVWRGSKLVGFEGINVQPDAFFSYRGFSLEAWSSVNYNGQGKEVDFMLGYETGNLSFLLTDYWCGSNYFRYGNIRGAHTYEGTASYSFGETFPLSITWNTLFYGNDYKENGTKRYSTYVELNYQTSLNDVGLTFALGASPWTSTWYHMDSNGDMKSGFQVVNVSLTAAKEIKISDSFSLPLFGSLVVNPCLEDINFVVGVSF